MFKIDALIQSVFQKISDRFTVLTGLTKFKLEKGALIVYLMSFWVGALSGEFNPAAIVTDLFVTLTSIPLIYAIGKNEARFLAKGELVRSVWHDTHMRIFFFLLWVFGIPLCLLLFPQKNDEQFIVPAIIATVISFIVWMYFSICTPKPPTKSKVRELLEKGLKFLKEVRGKLQPTPTPVPVPSQ